MKILKNSLLIAALGLLAEQAAAQCTLQSTFESCLLGEPDTVAQATAAASALEPATTAAVVDRLGAVNTGTSASETQSDFVAKLGVALDSMNFGDNGKEGLTLDWNGFLHDILSRTFFDNAGGWVKADHKLTVKANEPVLFEPLAKLVTAEQKDLLTGEIDDFSDTTIKWSFSPANRTFGRDFNIFADEFSLLYNLSFSQDIQNFVAADTATPLFVDLIQALDETRILEEHRIATGSAAEDLANVSLGRLAAACQEILDAGGTCPVEHVGAIVARFDAINRAQAEIEANIERRLNSGVFETWKQLLDNQRQLVFSVEHTQRDTLAGRDQMTGKFTWEFGKYNMSDFMDWRNAREDAQATANDPQRCTDILHCLTRYNEAYADKIAANLRFSLSVEYVHSDDYDFARAGLPGLTLDDEKSFVFGASLSRNIDTSGLISPALTNGKPGRAEFNLAYDDVDKDPTKNDRFLAKLTFTQQVRDGTNVTLGFVYSSKPEYRGQVDKEVSARFGVNYKFGSKKQ